MRLRVGGMTCASCTGAVERALRALPGVLGATVNLLTGVVEASWEAAGCVRVQQHAAQLRRPVL